MPATFIPPPARQGWALDVTTSGSMGIASIVQRVAEYYHLANLIFFNIRFDCVLSATLSDTVYVNLPVEPRPAPGPDLYNQFNYAFPTFGDNSSAEHGLKATLDESDFSRLKIKREDGSNFLATTYEITVSGFYMSDVSQTLDRNQSQEETRRLSERVAILERKI